MARGQRSKRSKVVPECQGAIDQWKYEIASELGLAVGNGRPSAGQAAGFGFDAEFGSEFAVELENGASSYADGVSGAAVANAGGSDYWGHLTARETGAVGGEITRRLIRQGQLQEMEQEQSL